MCKQKRYTRLLVSVFAILLMFLGGVEIRSAAPEFQITPTTYNIILTRLDPVNLNYTLANSLDTDLKFQINLDADTKTELNRYSVGIFMLTEQGRLDLANGIGTVDVPAGQTQSVLLQLVPGEPVDFTSGLKFGFKQIETEQRLTQSEYELSVNLESKLASSSETGQLEVILAAGVAVIAVGILVVNLIISKRKQSDGQDSV